MMQTQVEQAGAHQVRERRFASPVLRVLDMGTVPWLRSQSIHHGIAHTFTEDTPDTLVIVRPDRPYLCVGRHALGAPLSQSAVERSGLPVVRRALGGGTVLITPDQTFFVFVVHRRRLPLPDAAAMRWCLGAGAAAYRALGVDARMQGATDLHSGGRKLCGSGAATIGDAAVFGGNVIVDFDVDRFLDVLRYPSPATRELVARETRAQMGSVRACTGISPDAGAVAAAVRRGVEDACGVQLQRGEISAREMEGVARAERWLRRLPDRAVRPSRVWWKVRAGSGVLRAVLTRPRPSALLLAVRDRVVTDVVPDLPAVDRLVTELGAVLVGRSLDEPPSQQEWSASGLPTDAVFEISGWLRSVAHMVV